MINPINNEFTEEARNSTRKFKKKLESEMSYQSTYNGDALSLDWLDIIEEACPRLDIIIRNAKVQLVNGGNYGYTFRVMPKHEMLLDSENLDLVKWITN